VNEPVMPAGAARRAMPLGVAAGAAAAKPARTRAAVTKASMTVGMLKEREEIGVERMEVGSMKTNGVCVEQCEAFIVWQSECINPRPR
jgi:hypothetical protein